MSSDAIVRFTHYFLRAYDGLAPDLRQTGSTLAVGAAALVAGEVLYRQNWACMPIDVEPAAAVVNVLALHQPDLLRACYVDDAGRRNRLVATAVRALNSPAGGTVLPLLQNPAWLSERPAAAVVNDKPVRVSDVVPTHPAAVEALIRRVRGGPGIRNLTLRAAVIAAACPVGAEAAAWKGRLDALLADLNEEMKFRDTEHEPERHVPGPVAPAFDPRSARLIVGDPAIARHLMTLATRIEANRLEQLQRPTPQAYLDALKAGPATRSVLEVCGSEPVVEILADPVDLGPTAKGDLQVKRTGRLTWGDLMRPRAP